MGSTTCAPSTNSLCLLNNRFGVTAQWRTQTQFGMATAVPGSADEGRFWFFSADNLEVTVKVLNACSDPAPRYWVFAAATTNVEVAITVTDTQAGQAKTYFNPLGRSFVPVQDTSAFATCP